MKAQRAKIASPNSEARCCARKERPNLLSGVVLVSEVEKNGFAVIPRVFTRTQVERLATAFEPGARAGARTPLRNELVQSIARSEPLLNLLEAFSKEPIFPVRAILFDKNPDTNWAVAWHQDLTIAVRERIDVQGFGSWSLK